MNVETPAVFRACFRVEARKEIVPLENRNITVSSSQKESAAHTVSKLRIRAHCCFKNLGGYWWIESNIIVTFSM